MVIVKIIVMLAISTKYLHRKINPTIHYSLTQSTKYIDYKPGSAEGMFVSQRNLAFSSSNDYLLMKIKAVGINRAQILHRTGKYPINNEEQKYLGLEAAGQVYDPKTKQKIFDGIALMSGGSYAQWAKIPKSHIMPLPKTLSFLEGASIPEAWITAYQILGLSQLQQNSSVVIYAGASGVGTAATQIARHIFRYRPFCVVSSQKKANICRKYGASGTSIYRDNKNWAEDLLRQISSDTHDVKINNRFDAVLDCICATNINETIKILGVDGRWILYGTLSGIKCEMNFGQLLGKRLKLISTTLKSRSKEYKDELIYNFSQEVLPKFQSKLITPVVHQVFKCNWQTPSSFIDAHKLMENNQNSGKIIIQFIE